MPPIPNGGNGMLELPRSAFCCELVWAAPRIFGVPAGNNSGGILFGTAVPTTADYSLLQAVGLLGSVIMPVRY